MVVTVPVPQLLPQLLARAPGVAKAEEESLLLVGDVDYRGAAGTGLGLVASRSAVGTVRKFGKLDASRSEIVSIRDSFELRFPKGSVTVLRREKATEAAFREQAPGHRWLHLSTHGFFSPPEVGSSEKRLLHGRTTAEAGSPSRRLISAASCTRSKRTP